MDSSFHLLSKDFKERPALFRRVYAFNYCPEDYVHPSHWPQNLKTEWVHAVSNCSLAKKKLAFWLLQKQGVWGTFVDNFEKEPLWLALLEASQIQELFLYGGAALMHQRISQVVSREERQALEAQLGSHIYTFALKRASLMLGSLPSVLAEKEALQDLFEGVLHAACALFEACFSAADKALKMRFALKLPMSLEWDWDKSYSDDVALKAWQFLKRLLLREIDSDALSCFV